MINVEMIFLGATIHGIALALLLTFNHYANRKANRLLAVLVMLLTVAMWNVFARRSDDPVAVPVIDYYLWATPCLWAPALYLYVGELTKLNEVSRWRLLLHACPAIVIALLQIPLHWLKDSDVGAWLLQITHVSIVALIYPQIAIYFFSLDSAAEGLSISHQRNLFSDRDNHSRLAEDRFHSLLPGSYCGYVGEHPGGLSRG